MPSAPRFCSPVEFGEMIEQSGVISENFTFKEIYPIWNLSMMTQKDEINSDKHLNMNFTEFIEAICRVCDELEIPHLVDDADFLSEHDRNNPELIQLWGSRPLSYKIESFLIICAKNCFGPKYFVLEALPHLVKMKE